MNGAIVPLALLCRLGDTQPRRKSHLEIQAASESKLALSRGHGIKQVYVSQVYYNPKHPDRAFDAKTSLAEYWSDLHCIILKTLRALLRPGPVTGNRCFNSKWFQTTDISQEISCPLNTQSLMCESDEAGLKYHSHKCSTFKSIDNAYLANSHIK